MSMTFPTSRCRPRMYVRHDPWEPTGAHACTDCHKMSKRYAQENVLSHVSAFGRQSYERPTTFVRVLVLATVQAIIAFALIVPTVTVELLLAHDTSGNPRGRQLEEGTAYYRYMYRSKRSLCK